MNHDNEELVTIVEPIKKRKRVALIAMPRTGKHWLLNGIFDTLRIYPKYYADIITGNDRIPICDAITNNYSICYNNSVFFSAYQGIPDSLQSMERLVFLDRRDHKAQAKSYYLADKSGIKNVLTQAGLDLARSMHKAFKLKATEIRQIEQQLQRERQAILDALEADKAGQYLIMYYEDLVVDYDKTCTLVLGYLFDLPDAEICRFHDTLKITEEQANE